VVVENLSAGSNFIVLGTQNSSSPYVSSGATWDNTLESSGDPVWSTQFNPSPHTSNVSTPYLEIDGTNPTSVPETATPALLTAGFAGLMLMAAAHRKNAARFGPQH
jgi:hypothetical protein